MMPKKSIAEQIYERLSDLILSESANSNTIFAERELAEKFGVSRVPVREALQKFCQKGFLINIPRKGYMIRRISTEELKNIQEVRYNLECLAICRIIRQANDTEIKKLSSWREYAEDSSNLISLSQSSNAYFHHTLGQISGNPILEEAIDHYLDDISLAYYQNPSFQNFKIYYDEIIDSLLQREQANAENWLRKDMQIDIIKEL